MGVKECTASSKVIGVLGGGQLGRMMMEAAHRLNIQLIFLDSENSPANQLTSNFQIGSFRNPQDVLKLSQSCDLLTIEIEHVELESLAGLNVHPSLKTIQLIQDKYQQKLYFSKHVPCPLIMEVCSIDDLDQAAKSFGFPFMVKNKRDSYDGKGNFQIKNRDDLKTIMDASKAGLYAEKWCYFEKELAVIVVKSSTNIATYPVVETFHRDSICHTVIAPASVSTEVANKATLLAKSVVSLLSGNGVFAVELFLLKDGSVYLNEVAPRPHNSGHFTIEACETSQFENHLRAILDLPLGSTEMKTPNAAMINLIGASNDCDCINSPIQQALLIPGAAIHLYGKAECRKNRKMGHLTITANSKSQLHTRLHKIWDTVGGSPLRTNKAPLVGVIMGSDSDLPKMRDCCEILEQFNVPFEVTIVSAHRTPERLMTYSKTAYERGLRVIVAGAGGAAHLPGMVASMTCLPVVGVPIALKHLDGVDSLHSIVQMPRGVPVAAVAIDNSMNAGLLAIRMLGGDYSLKMTLYQHEMKSNVLEKAKELELKGWSSY
eukprot:NODE_305_length_11349_cov_0.358222.p1 type:complete len:546 gc:universal NODE_305_length_11349_cov_0.358222:6238-7875(+)